MQENYTMIRVDLEFLFICKRQNTPKNNEKRNVLLFVFKLSGNDIEQK